MTLDRRARADSAPHRLALIRARDSRTAHEPRRHPAMDTVRPAGPTRVEPGASRGILHTLIANGLSVGEAAAVIRDARATIQVHETLALAVARVLRLEADACASRAADCATAANLVAFTPELHGLPEAA